MQSRSHVVALSLSTLFAASAASAVCYTLIDLGDSCDLAPCASPCIGSVVSSGEPVTTSLSLEKGGRGRAAIDFLCLQEFTGKTQDGVCGVPMVCQSTVGGYVLTGVICRQLNPA